MILSRVSQVPLPHRPKPWYSLLRETTLAGIRDIAETVLQLYTRDKPDPDKLEKTVASLKQAQAEAKARLKSSLGENTPTTLESSRPATPSKVSPYEDRREGDRLING